MISHRNRMTVPLLMSPPPARGPDQAIACCDTSPQIPIWGLAAPEEVADGGLVGLALVAGDVGARHPHRVAEEGVLVQRLAARERRDAGVPDQPEQPEPLGPAQRARWQV